MHLLLLITTLIVTNIHTAHSSCFFLYGIADMYPPGPLNVEVGQPYNLTCVSKNSKFTSKELRVDQCVQLSQRLVCRNESLQTAEKSIYNSTTVLITDVSYTPLTRQYRCKAENPDGTLYHACDMHVYVGTKPQPVKDLRCEVSMSTSDTLTCNWTVPENPVETAYKASIKSLAVTVLPWVSPSAAYGTSAFWDEGFNVNSKDGGYVLKITATNTLGTNVSSYQINSYSIIRPAPADKLSVSVEERVAFVSWKLPLPLNMFIESIGWLQKLEIKSEFDDDWSIAYNDTNTNIKGITSVTLPVSPYTNYKVRLYLRSIKASSDYWSKPAISSFLTPLQAPDFGPNITSGSLEIVESIDSRKVFIFWQKLEKRAYNGPDFTYVVEVRKNGHIIQTLVTDKAFIEINALENNIPYTFYIYAQNSEGKSPPSITTLPASRDLPRPPKTVTKISHLGGLFEISWDSSQVAWDIIESYTVFYCYYNYARPYPCNGNLNWITVPGYQTIANVTVPVNSEHYQFAVSINTPVASSGMTWASCTVLASNVVDRLNDVWISYVTNTTMGVRWRMDCSEKLRVITHFKIIYCKVDDSNATCEGKKEGKLIRKNEKSISGGIITGLQPYTKYRITVSIITKAGEGRESDALINSTNEGFPLDPPSDVVVESVSYSDMEIVWNPPTQPRGIIRLYKVYINDRVLTTPTNRIAVTQLLSYHMYSISISACTQPDAGMCSPMSEVIFQQTEITAPEAVSAPQVELLNNSWIEIKWNEPMIPNGPISFYEIRSRHIDEDVVQNNTYRAYSLSKAVKISECKVDGKDPQSYTVDVRAVNEYSGELLIGPWSPATKSFPCTPKGASLEVVIGVGTGSALIVLFLIGVILIYRRAKKSQEEPSVILSKQLTTGLKAPPIIYPSSLEEKSYNLNDYYIGLTSGDHENLTNNGEIIRNTSPYSSTSSNEKLITKSDSLNEFRTRNSSAESSGVSSGKSSNSSSHASADFADKLQNIDFGMRMNSAESSGCSSGKSSSAVSSLGRSFDSGTDISKGNGLFDMEFKDDGKLKPIEDTAYVRAALTPEKDRANAWPGYVFAENVPSMWKTADVSPYVTAEQAAQLPRSTSSTHGDFMKDEYVNVSSPPVGSTSPAHSQPGDIKKHEIRISSPETSF